MNHLGAHCNLEVVHFLNKCMWIMELISVVETVFNGLIMVVKIVIWIIQMHDFASDQEYTQNRFLVKLGRIAAVNCAIVCSAIFLEFDLGNARVVGAWGYGYGKNLFFARRLAKDPFFAQGHKTTHLLTRVIKKPFRKLFFFLLKKSAY